MAEWKPNAKLFAKLVAYRGEDSQTEILAELLRHPTLRRRFCCDVLDLGLPDSTIDRLAVDTQVADEGGKGQPDLELHGETSRIVIENKLGAPFTENQPVQYHKGLAKWVAARSDSDAFLVIQAPQTRCAPLAAEAGRQLGVNLEHDGWKEHEGVALRVVSWEKTAAVFQDVELADPVAQYLRDGFVALVPPVTAAVTMPISREVLDVLQSEQFSRVMGALSGIVKDVLADLRGRGLDAGLSQTTEFDFVGFYVWLHDHKDLRVWVGVVPRMKLVVNTGPLVAELVGEAYSDDLLDRLKATGVPLVDGDPLDFGMVLPLHPEPDLDGPEQAKRISDRVESLLIQAVEIKAGEHS